MKKIIGLIICAVLGPALHAQVQDQVTNVNYHSYFSVGAGLNSSSGLIGIQYEQMLGNRSSVYAGIGPGSWGLKTSVGTRIYSNSPLGSALGISLIAVVGSKKAAENLKVIESGVEVNKKVVYDRLPVYALNISWIKFWKVGNKNRISLELGYSVRLSNPANSNYSLITSGVALTENAQTALEGEQPGGPIVAFGFHFARK